MKLFSAVVISVGISFCAHLSMAEVDPADRTADMPDSWLVVYNAKDSLSYYWKRWYIQQWGIPEANVLGLDVSAADEKVQRDYFHDRIFYPVRDHLDSHPELKAKIMGIVVGCRVPGNFYLDADHPPLQGGGGWSVASNLQDLTSPTSYQRPNPHHFVAYWQPNEVRLTKATLANGCYITARVEGPTPNAIADLTIRAKAITTSTVPLPATDRLYYDYLDVGAPAGDEWTSLRYATERDNTSQPEWKFPWLAFESESEPTPNCALRFSYYRLTGWDTVPWGGTPLGTRILGMAFNSWGATTVRSTTDHGGRYVPNALVNGQFAAAVGATAEPYAGNEPDQSTIVWCLAQGWTLGEAVFHATPGRNYMWEVIGDPLLTVPHWFANPPPNPPGDLGPPAYVDGSESTNATPTLAFNQLDDAPDDLLAYRIQLDDDGDFSSPVVDYTSVPLPQGPTSFTVGQAPAGGSYAAGEEGQQLQVGAYHWRVRSHDGTTEGDWTTADDSPLVESHDGATEGNWATASDAAAVAFVIIEPLTMVGAVSRKTHGQEGDLDIDLPLDSSASAGIECRANGPTRVIVTFNRPVAAADGVLDETEVDLPAGTLGALTIDGHELTIELIGVPDESCLAITLAGICDLGGHPLPGDNDIQIGVLQGDANGDSGTNLTDFAQIKALNGQPVGPATTRSDLNCDGLINLIDMAMAKGGNGNMLTCP